MNAEQGALPRYSTVVSTARLISCGISWGRLLAALFALLAIAMLPRAALAVAGIEGTFEYAFDAPWRIEPSSDGNSGLVYGAIPIQLTIHDAEMIYLDYHDGTTLGDVCGIVVREETPNGVRVTPYDVSDLAEIELSARWRNPDDSIIPFVCRPSQGEDCRALEYLGGSSEWHAVLWHEIDSGFSPGDVVPLSIQMEVTKGDIEPGHDPAVPCASASSDEKISLTNSVRVLLAPEALPRFGDGWLYGDLHYHSQGTDNEGEAGYSYRGVVRAMGSMGIDFAFATEHASNSQQWIDLDATTAIEVDNGLLQLFASFATGLPVFALDGDPTFPLGSASIEFGYANALRDMSENRFTLLNGALNGAGGVNNAEAFAGFAGRPMQNVLSYGVAPRLFLGGEVDVIPELAPNVSDVSVAYGNGLFSIPDSTCGGWISNLEPVLLGEDCDASDLLEYTPTGALVRDVQAMNELHYGRMHLIHIPRQQLSDRFVASDTGVWGGANRRLVEDHVGEDGILRGGVLPEIEAQGDYAFLAHPLSGADKGGSGPSSIPWSDHMIDKAWRSDHILGLQFWNEDVRLTHDIQKWTKARFTTAGSTPPGGECDGDGDCFGPIPGLDPEQGRDIGYERLDCEEDGTTGSLDLGCSYRFIPHASRRAGFESGVFRLASSAAEQGLWGDYLLTSKPESSVEHELHHGAFTWDRVNHWGLDVRRTASLNWLAQGEPRRFFMAGGSDAHGDLNYRREGYLVGTKKLTDAAIGKPRNLVEVPLQGSTGPGGEAIYWQQDIVDSLVDGRFSITDGPALRIFVDHDEDCVQDRGETPMGAVHSYSGEATLPLCVEWKSTAEFGVVDRIDLYLGARSSGHDLAQSSHAPGRTYAPQNAGPRTPTAPETGYAVDPVGALRIPLAQGGELAGTYFLELDLSRFPADDGSGGDVAADRFFVRAVAVTEMADENACILADAAEGGRVRRGECIRRYAYTNPIWAVQTEPDYVFLEAEDGKPDRALGDTFELQYPMQIASHVEASGGKYIWVPQGTTTGGGHAAYYFSVETSGDYLVWGREASDDTGSDSFYVTVEQFGGGFVEPRNADTQVTWFTKRAGGVDNWVWDRVRQTGQSQPAYFHLVPGNLYILKIAKREDGTKLDRLVVTNDHEFRPNGYFERPAHPTAPGSPRIDWCLNWGENCGAPAAHAYCELAKGEGYVASDFALAENIGSATTSTFVLGETDPSRQSCTGTFCDGFEFIRCVDTRTAVSRPTSAGYRIDWCLNWGTNCGMPSADRVCAIYEGGDHHAVSYSFASNVGPTFVLGDNRICWDSTCDSFESVECAHEPPMTTVANDRDFDGLQDFWDNCPDDPNPLQENADGDVFGDACDPDPFAVPQCNDGIDNDGDGLLDSSDPGCASIIDSTERSDDLACDDGFDNDADGLADLLDPGCSSGSDPSERSPGHACDDGIDNDGDGAIDYPEDFFCESPSGLVEGPPCSDGNDDDYDGSIDMADPDCTSPDDPTEFHIAAGDILVSDPTRGTIYRVDPGTGKEMVVYAGFPLVTPWDIALEANHRVLVADQSGQVVRLDLEARVAEVVSSGGLLASPKGIAVEEGGSILITNSAPGQVIRIDARDGSQTLLADGSSGLPIGVAEDVAVTADGRIFASDPGFGRVIEIDPVTGEVSSFGEAGSTVVPSGLVVTSTGSLVALELTISGTVEIEIETEETGQTTSWGFEDPARIELAADGSWIVTDGAGFFGSGPGEVYRVDPAGLEVSLLNTGISHPTGLALVPPRHCEDGLDNDGDGLADEDDPGCADPRDPSERNLLVACDDGVDDDGDGLIDYPEDPDCDSAEDPREAPGEPRCGLGADLVLVAYAFRRLVGRPGPASCRGPLAIPPM